MRIILLLLLSVIVSGCGLQKEKKITNYNVHPELQPYVSTFASKKALSGTSGKIIDLEAHFSDSLGSSGLGTVIGVCIRSRRTSNNGLIQEVRETPVMKINRSYWDSASDADREQLMYHELGHCILKRDHEESMLSQSQPKSIMYPLHLGSGYYVASYSHYMNELFNLNTTAVAFTGLSFDDQNYASTLTSEEYHEVIEDDSHYTNCVHDL